MTRVISILRGVALAEWFCVIGLAAVVCLAVVL
jgi:hypothetical protein